MADTPIILKVERWSYAKWCRSWAARIQDFTYSEESFEKIKTGEPVVLNGKMYISEGYEYHPVGKDSWPRQLPVSIYVGTQYHGTTEGRDVHVY